MKLFLAKGLVRSLNRPSSFLPFSLSPLHSSFVQLFSIQSSSQSVIHSLRLWTLFCFLHLSLLSVLLHRSLTHPRFDHQRLSFSSFKSRGRFNRNGRSLNTSILTCFQPVIPSPFSSSWLTFNLVSRSCWSCWSPHSFIIPTLKKKTLASNQPSSIPNTYRFKSCLSLLKLIQVSLVYGYLLLLTPYNQYYLINSKPNSSQGDGIGVAKDTQLHHGPEHI